MNLGFVSAIVPELSSREVLQLASQCGYDCVELMCWPAGKAERRYAGVSHVDVAEIVRTKSAARLNDLCAELNVSASALGYYPNLLDADAATTAPAAEHLKCVIEAASIAGIDCVTSFVGRDHRLSVEDNWPKFLDVWRPLIKYAEGLNVRVGIENCPMSFSTDEWPGGKNLATTPTIWRRMFEAIPSAHFGLNYDPSHMIWQHMDYLKPIREFSDRFFHVHAKDVRIDRQRLDDVGIMAHPAEYHTPKLPGMGDVNWGKFFSALTDSGYAGPVCVEVEDRAYEGTIEARKKSLVQSHTYLRNYVPT